MIGDMMPTNDEDYLMGPVGEMSNEDLLGAFGSMCVVRAMPDYVRTSWNKDWESERYGELIRELMRRLEYPGPLRMVI